MTATAAPSPLLRAPAPSCRWRLRGPGAYQDAQRRSTFGPYDWIVYSDKLSGERIAERANARSLKRAMLQVGTRGVATMLIDGAAHEYAWWTLNNVRRQFVLGFR
jgi:hypothetical protein